MTIENRVLAVCAAITALGAAVAVIAKGARWVRQVLRKLDRLLIVLVGDPSLPDDDPNRHGLDARVRKIERALTDTVLPRLGAIEHQLKPNGGQASTIADAVSRLDQAQGGPGVKETR